MSSGYVSGPGAEAIEPFAMATERAGLEAWHLGPPGVDRMTQHPFNWRTFSGISDARLAAELNRCAWVSGLRYGEGFELPVIEGLACGARPIVFDRADMRDWYAGHAVFVPELTGRDLEDVLTAVMAQPPDPVTLAERESILRRFDWEPIVRGFWEALCA